MFLKVMHDGADEFLAQADSDATYSVFADVTACDFHRRPDGSAYAHLQCREPIKTAEVPGYAEIEKHIDVVGDAFLMNEQGRTISVFKLKGYRASDRTESLAQNDDGNLEIARSAVKNQAALDKFYLSLPYWIAVGMLNLSRKDCFRNQASQDLINDFKRLRIATDA